MAKRIFLPESEPAATLLTVEALEMGFSDGHVEAFRETVIAAIRETSDLLRTEEMPARWRAQLDRQVRHMRHYVEIADLYLAKQNGSARRLIN